MKPLFALLLLLGASQAVAEETPASSKATTLQAKLLAFLTGGQPPGLPSEAIPGLTLHEPPPTWLVHWQSSLLHDLQQTDLTHSHHPLIRATLQVVLLDNAAKPRFQPIPVAPLPADALLCPRGAPVRLHVEVLHPGDDIASPWLGVDLACVDDKPTLRRQLRLLVHATGQGQVERAFGIGWSQPLPLTSQPEAAATPEFALHPAILDKRFTWLVALPSGGWLAQLQAVSTATWQSENALPRFEDMTAGEDPTSTASDHRDAPRYTILFADDGAPRAALLRHPVDAEGRLPLWREGAWDLALPRSEPEGPARSLILQRIALPGAAAAGHVGRAWTRAGYAVWQVTHESVSLVDLPLLPVDQEGVWDCEGEPPVQKILCTFRRLGPLSEAATEFREFVLLPGPLAAFKLAPRAE